MGFWNIARRFEIFTCWAKGKCLARSVRTNRFDFYSGCQRRRLRLLVLVIEKEPELRWHTCLKDGNLDKTVTSAYQQSIAWSVSSIVVEMRMSVPLSTNLLNYIKEAESYQRPTCNLGEPAANLIAQLDTTPCNQKSKSCGEQDMSATCEHGYQQGFRFAPLLDAGREHKGQPVRGNGRVEEGDREPGGGNRREKLVIHKGDQ